MRETSSVCLNHVKYVTYVRGTTEMCSRDAPGLNPALTKANGKNSSPQASLQTETSIEGCLPKPGGRLKFFKDGKFILELSHRRDGERTTWFPVPKKTFWPPASTTPNRQESSTSLSASDDNSSIQSSPWQRDHCWKQNHPRRCVFSDSNFYYRRDPRQRLSTPARQLARLRRRPHEPSGLLFFSDTTRSRSRPTPVNRTRATPGRALILIIDKLSRLDPNVVSPRKRILRDMERVTLEDQASKRRATPQPIFSTKPITSIPPVPINAINHANSVAPITQTQSAQSQRQISSYSITSILGEDKSNSQPGFLRNLLKVEDNDCIQYPSGHSYRGRMDHNFAGSANCSIGQPIYGVPILPAPYRAPGLWMHYPPGVHYSPPMPTYPPPPPPHPTSPMAHYKDFRDGTLTPPSDVPLNLSKHAG